jgi:hypothetical protein
MVDRGDNQSIISSESNITRDTVDKQVHEVSMSSNISLFLTKDENRSTSLLSSNNYDSNSTSGPETMFPENENEPEQA